MRALGKLEKVLQVFIVIINGTFKAVIPLNEEIEANGNSGSYVGCDDVWMTFGVRGPTWDSYDCV